MYLATTRLKEFWPEYKPIVLLGEWCIPEGKLFNFKNGSEYLILPYPWDDRKRFEKAAEYVQNVYENLLFQFSKGLNEIHGINKSTKYWRIIIGPWLSWYLDAFYDRYVCLLDALKHDSEIITIGLDPKSYVIPDNFGHFTDLYISDEYNLMLYTQILENFGINMIRKPLIENWQYKKKHDVSIEKLKNSFENQLNDIKEFIVRKSKIALVSTGISFSAGLKLWINSGFKISFCPHFRQKNFVSSSVNKKMRNQLKNFIKPRDDFESIVKSTITLNIPKTYIEDFEKTREFTLNRFGQSMPKIILSANGWYSDESFKIYAAEANERGVKLFSMQHGGYYGMLKYISAETHEQKISEGFYSWGWNDKKANVFPMPALKLINLKDLKRIGNSKNKPIVLITTKHPRYLYRFQSHPVGPQWKEYFQWEFRFVENLSENVKNKFKIRPYPHTYGWGFKKLFHDIYPDISFDKSKNIKKLYISASMFIVDHPSTTFLELFSANIPTILFWDAKKFILRETANFYFNKLRNVGILYDTPESAAAKVNEIYKAPESWWQQKEVQRAKDEFCDKFANMSEQWLKEWKIKLLNSIKI